MSKGATLLRALLEPRMLPFAGRRCDRDEAFVPETKGRYFVLDGHPHSPSFGESIPPIVVEVANRFTASRFFSVNVAMTVEGQPHAVEIGDGQVSDLVDLGARALRRNARRARASLHGA